MDGRAGRDAIAPAMLADSANTSSALVAIAKNTSLARDTRRRALDAMGRSTDGMQTIPASVTDPILAIARDEENMWMVTDHQGESRASYNGALDVDVVFSPFFNALPIRRLGLHEHADTVTVPTIYVNLPEMSITSAPVSYRSPAPGSGDRG